MKGRALTAPARLAARPCRAAVSGGEQAAMVSRMSGAPALLELGAGARAGEHAGHHAGPGPPAGPRSLAVSPATASSRTASTPSRISACSGRSG